MQSRSCRLGACAAARQTKSVCHAARNSPIACILKGGEIVPCSIGGLFRRPEKREGEVERRGYFKEQSIALVGAKKVSPLGRAFLKNY